MFDSTRFRSSWFDGIRSSFTSKIYSSPFRVTSSHITLSMSIRCNWCLRRGCSILDRCASLYSLTYEQTPPSHGCRKKAKSCFVQLPTMRLSRASSNCRWIITYLRLNYSASLSSFSQTKKVTHALSCLEDLSSMLTSSKWESTQS